MIEFSNIYRESHTHVFYYEMNMGNNSCKSLKVHKQMIQW